MAFKLINRVLSEAEIETGVEELRLARKDGEGDEEFFQRSLAHAWLLICGLRIPDLVADPDQLVVELEAEENQRKIETLKQVVELFKAYFSKKINTLDDAIIILAFGLQILNLNYFWKDIRRFMSDSKSDGLKTLVLVAGLQSESQLIQEALIEVLYDLSFSDFEGQEVNRVLYRDCQEVVNKWVGTERWNSQQTFGSFIELLDDLIWSQALYNQPKLVQSDKFTPKIDLKIDQGNDEGEEEKRQEDQSESEEEKEFEHGMEDISKPLKLKTPKNENSTLESKTQSQVEHSQIYHRKDEKFLSFISSVFYHFLNVKYRLKIDQPTVFEMLEDSWADPKSKSIEQLNEGQEGRNEQEREIADQEEALDLEAMKQIQLEDDGISLGSDTTTECSEYSEELIDEEDIEKMIKTIIKTLCSLIGSPNHSVSYYSTYTAFNLPINPLHYVKDKLMKLKDFSKFIENWISKNHPKNESRYSNIEEITAKCGTLRRCQSVLTHLRYTSFGKMTTKEQFEFLKKLTQNEIIQAKFSREDYSDELILEILKQKDIQNSPKASIINSLSSVALWGRLFYLRPYPRPGVTTSEQYQEEKWVRQEQIYEKAVDLIHGILVEGGERVQSLAKFLGKKESKFFAYFVRSILKPEIGHPLKTVELKELKRSDFQPFRIDNGFEMVEVDLGEIEYGDQVYSFKKTIFDEEFSENQIFYLNGHNSIFTRTDLKKTEVELSEYPDEYRLDDENNEDEFNMGLNQNNDQDAEFALNNLQNQIVREAAAADERLQRNRQAAREQRQGRKGAKDQPEAADRYYKLKKYSILAFETRRAEKLTRKEKFDKLDNRVSTDFLRSGECLLNKIHYRPNQQFNGTRRRVGQFIRRPQYGMHTPYKFDKNNFCQKFDHMTLYLFREEGRATSVKCLYVKRLKKIVLRTDLLKYSSPTKILSLERIHCKGKVINFDDPEQREPYYNRLFQRANNFTKKIMKMKLFSEEENQLPAHSIKTSYYQLLDYTTRSIRLAKSDYILKRQVPSPRISEEGNYMELRSVAFMVKKAMKKGSPVRFEAIGRDFVPDESYFSAGKFSNDLVSYNHLNYNIRTNCGRYLRKIGLSVFYLKGYVQTRSYGGGASVSYTNKQKFEPLIKPTSGGDEAGDDDKVYVYFNKEGSKKIFRVPFEDGTMICFEARFRRIYFLKVDDEEIKLRVVSVDAVSRFLGNN